MEENQYIIISKTALEKRIEQLEKQIPEYKYEDYYEILIQERDTLKDILHQSIPLLPEIEKAFDAGIEYGFYAAYNGDSEGDIQDNETYIRNLKLDI